MRISFVLLFLAAAALRASAFAPRASVGAIHRRQASLASAVVTSRQTPLTVVQARGKPIEDDGNYWQGEWVCADCGYIYDADDCGGLYFEQQKKGWVCPQCRGPRRRFAKKVGDQVGITQDGGDAPILLFSFLGLAGTVAFAFWFSNTQ